MLGWCNSRCAPRRAALGRAFPNHEGKAERTALMRGRRLGFSRTRKICHDRRPSEAQIPCRKEATSQGTPEKDLSSPTRRPPSKGSVDQPQGGQPTPRYGPSGTRPQALGPIRARLGRPAPPQVLSTGATCSNPRRRCTLARAPGVMRSETNSDADTETLHSRLRARSGGCWNLRGHRSRSGRGAGTESSGRLRTR